MSRNCQYLVICDYRLPTSLQPQSCINKRLLCPSLASTLRNPTLPKAVSKRKYVGLDETHFDEDVEKRPDDGQEYDPEGDYIYDARKYFNPEKYREIIAHQEEKKKKQEESEKKFYYKAFRRHRGHYNRLNADSGHLSVNYVDVGIDGLSSSATSLQHSQYCINDGKLQNEDIRSSKHHKKMKKKSKHSKHSSHSHILNSSHKHSKRKKDEKKKHKKKHKRKKLSDTCSISLADSHDIHSPLSKKHRAKLRHRSRRHSRLCSSQEPCSTVTNMTSLDFSYGTRNVGEMYVGNGGDNADLCYVSDDSVSHWGYTGTLSC